MGTHVGIAVTPTRLSAPPRTSDHRRKGDAPMRCWISALPAARRHAGPASDVINLSLGWTAGHG